MGRKWIGLLSCIKIHRSTHVRWKSQDRSTNEWQRLTDRAPVKLTYVHTHTHSHTRQKQPSFLEVNSIGAVTGFSFRVLWTVLVSRPDHGSSYSGGGQRCRRRRLGRRHLGVVIVRPGDGTARRGSTFQILHPTLDSVLLLLQLGREKEGRK